MNQPTLKPRKLARSVARANMKDRGLRQVNKKYAMSAEDKRESAFARNWRAYAMMQRRRKDVQPKKEKNR